MEKKEVDILKHKQAKTFADRIVMKILQFFTNLFAVEPVFIHRWANWPFQI
jgi:hypothetical protein